MYANKKICFLLVKFLVMVVCEAKYDHRDEKSSDVRYCSSNYKADDEKSCDKELRECRDAEISDEILLRRTVNKLLSRIKIREEDSWFHGRVELEGTTSELETLKNFGLGILTLQEVAPILEDVIKTTEFGGVYECGLCLQSLELQLYIFIDTYKYHIPSIILGLYLIQFLRENKTNFRHIAILGIFCTCALIFADTLPDTLREVEQEENMKEAPIHCRPGEMSWTDKIMALFASAKDCEKYEAEMNDRPATILKLAIFRTLDRICGLVMALSFNIVFTIITFLAKFLLSLITLIIGSLKECSLTTIVMLTLISYGIYFYHSARIRRWEPRQNLRNAICEDVFSSNPKRTRNRRRKRGYEQLW